jgi:GTP-binding protein Era
MGKKKFRTGYVAVIGRPNVGKSTVLNYLMGYKISIVTEKPETTRNTIQGILTREDAQIIFVDTPGMHRPKNLLGRSMVRGIKQTIDDVDLVVCVCDVIKKITLEDELLFKLLHDCKKPCIALVNKADARKKGYLLPVIEEIARHNIFKEILPTSALMGDNMDELLKVIISYLPEGEALFPTDHLTDKSSRFMVAEMIREKVLLLAYQEVPHSVAVLIDEYSEREDKNVLYLRATIFVERQSQKKIIIGKKGALLKQIGSEARKDIEAFAGKKVFLDLWVKVYENWRKDPQALKMLEYV